MILMVVLVASDANDTDQLVCTWYETRLHELHLLYSQRFAAHAIAGSTVQVQCELLLLG